MSFRRWFKSKRQEFKKSPSYIFDGLMLSLNEQIVMAMEREGISRRELEKKIQLPQLSIEKLLQGSVNPTLKLLIDIGVVLNIRLYADYSEFKFVDIEEEGGVKPTTISEFLRENPKYIRDDCTSGIWMSGVEHEGLFLKWYPDGIMSDRLNWKNSKLHGLDEGWYQNGQISSRSNWKNGKRDGLTEWWHYNGEIQEISIWKDGVKIKPMEMSEFLEEHTKYTKDDCLSGIWVSGVKGEGLYLEWHENGNIRRCSNWKNGRGHGLEEQWYSNGQMLMRRKWKDGRFHGIEKQWYKNGKIIETLTWKNGKKLEDVR